MIAPATRGIAIARQDAGSHDCERKRKRNKKNKNDETATSEVGGGVGRENPTSALGSKATSAVVRPTTTKGAADGDDETATSEVGGGVGRAK